MHSFILGLIAGGALAGLAAAIGFGAWTGAGVPGLPAGGVAIGLGATFAAALSVLGVHSLERLRQRHVATGPAQALNRFGIDALAAFDAMLTLMRQQPDLLTGDTDAQVRQYMLRRCEKLGRSAERNMQAFCPLVPGAGAPVSALAGIFEALQQQWRWADHDTVRGSCEDGLRAARQLCELTRGYL